MARQWQLRGLFGILLLHSIQLVHALKFDSNETDYNLNTNQAATDPLDYSGTWEDHTFHPSPDSWRFPFYTLFLDKFVNGDPSNDDINGTLFEHDVMGTQMRHGGDLKGLVDTLDYLQGMGIKGLYIAGTPFINMPWKSDGYSPIDFTLLDHHFGKIEEWRAAIDEIHRRKMYVVLDNTFSTMADLIGFDGFLNESAPFRPKEHKVIWKGDQRYPDFDFGDKIIENCEYPKFWDESGEVVEKNAAIRNNFSDTFDSLKTCYDSDFDQRQLSKFASVQDRLREWKPTVLQKLQHMHCLTISMLDIDGFRLDKATQATVDALANFTESLRECARENGKENFFVAGEITGGNTFGSIYLGRGREPKQKIKDLAEAVKMTNNSDPEHFLREVDKNGLDASAFHYSIYRSLQRFLGMDGQLASGYDTPINFVDAWNEMLLTNDLVNPNTGKLDPRHMYGTSNQDVFRWPTIKSGTEKMLLGLFVTTLHMPGIPLLNWGEEQAFYTLDNTAANYVFGRQPISSSLAWQQHGCYNVGSTVFHDFPLDAGANSCNDDKVSQDHRDPTHPIRNIIKSFYHLRSKNPILNDGWLLQSLSNQTHEIQLPGSNQTKTELGMWSVMRNQFFGGVQTLTDNKKPAVWLVYQNEDHSVDYEFDCASNDTALIAPFDDEDEVRNLLSPYDTLTLKKGPKKLGIDGSEKFSGCLDKLTMAPWDFRAYVRKADWIEPAPMLTKFSPGHDARLLATVDQGQKESIDVEFQYSQEMDCDSITKNIVITSTTADKSTAGIDSESVVCSKIKDASPPPYIGAIPSTWSWKAKLIDVSHGIHTLSVHNASNTDGVLTESTDHVFLRIGGSDNPMVFPRIANYSTNVLFKDADGSLQVSHKASGADKWRYSTNWGSTWSDWQDYPTNPNVTVEKQDWSGTDRQKWEGEHIMLQYWSRTTGSSTHLQHADLNPKQAPRRLPHIFAHGIFNQFGFDGGMKNKFKLSDNLWKFHLMTEWPHAIQANVWGMNPDGLPDQSFVFGDIDKDTVLDRLPPDALSPPMINMTEFPPSPYLAYQISIDDATYRYKLTPAGNRTQQLIVFALLWTLSIFAGVISIWGYMGAFYAIKFNKVGLKIPKGIPSFWSRRKFDKLPDNDVEEAGHRMKPLFLSRKHERYDSGVSGASIVAASKDKRRKVIIATMEYDIEDWAIKIKIGGLGVMAQLMGKSLAHQDLIWVVPMVGGVDYPTDQIADPMVVTVLGNPYEVQVQYHQLNNITYVLLDAPVFRQQSKSEPYPPRMDDLDSAIYYSAWNACIAEAIKRFEPDIYHINDYHGAAAPLYLLPETIPCCLSLHNAEFQGLWPMRTDQEQDEVSRVYNLDKDVIEKYVQFGEVFNLLHAGVSYLRVHQKGFGAVGVSNKYGVRSFARYPIFWGLKEIGKLPNPDPSDTAPWNREEEERQVIKVDPAYEASRGDLRRQAQEWAGLEVNPKAELFVFVGRWSNQKGIDLIADVFPAILEKHKDVQLICVGPCIDLYGKFAALKLDVMMKKYPKRVFSKPEFTALPPFIFSGAEFALIPSRDEPFGLVAVEFGRKGALGVGARVGGLGQMPGWWFTVESTTTSHLMHQFKSAIEDALEAKTEVRAMMRARSAKQRFPVQKWVEDLDILQSTAIRIHQREANPGLQSSPRLGYYSNESNTLLPRSRDASPSAGSVYETQPRPDSSSPNLNRTLSLGSRAGPGHLGRTPHLRITDADISEGEEDFFASRESFDVREETISREEAERANALEQLEGRGRATSLSAPLPALVPGYRSRSPSPDPRELERGRSRNRHSEPYLQVQPDEGAARRASADSLLPVAEPRDRSGSRFSTSSRLSVSSVLDLTAVKGTKSDYSLQKIELTFNDTTGEYYRAFETMLDKLNGKTSEKDLCIEEYLVESEKAWFKKYRDAKLGRSHDRKSSDYLRNRLSVSPYGSRRSSVDADDRASVGEGSMEDFLLGDNYQRPSLIKRWMLTRLGDWPLYSFLLALGQIMAANSYQITLLTGGESPKPSMIYTIGGIYITASVIWWLLFRTMKARFVLAIPFVMYGLAFFFIGMAPLLPKGSGRDWMRNVADGLYAASSASGALFFTLNFGDEGGSPISSWVYRACIIQGTQQIYITGLFYWGRTITEATPKQKIEKDVLSSSPYMAAVTVPIAALLWLIAITLYTSLPSYYHQRPGKIPSFYKTLVRRKLISWFFIAMILQNYFLSSQYGRSWQYLWSSTYAPAWTVALLVLVFFILIWASILFVFSKLSKSHSWILPIFAIGLLAPRWAQQWWGTSGYGLWLPWMPGGPVGGALAGRALWLWLGVLDAVQGVGFGMILLQTLTRIHIGVTLITAQILGTAVTLIAKATAPNRNGPGDVYPDLSAGVVEALIKPWFWIALVSQLVIPIGFFMFFRKEQLSKP